MVPASVLVGSLSRGQKETVSVVDMAVAVVEVSWRSGMGVEKTSSWEPSRTGGKVLSSQAPLLQGRIWALRSNEVCDRGAPSDSGLARDGTVSVEMSGAVMVAESVCGRER